MALLSRRLHVGLLVERRYLAQAQPAGLAAALVARGHRVTSIDPDAGAYQVGDDRWLARFDVIAPRGRSWPLLTLLKWAERCGVATVLSARGIAAVHNKADMAVALAAQGVVTPPTLLATPEELARRAPADWYPLVLKPRFGDNGQGVRLVRRARDLQRLDWPEPVALAQRFVSGPGYDLKLYGIGGDVWAVHKPGPRWVEGRIVASPTTTAAARPVTPDLHVLACRCRDLFGLDLYGVDCLETPQGPVVIEVNDFPNYTGVPDASERLADHVVAAWRRAHRRRAS